MQAYNLATVRILRKNVTKVVTPTDGSYQRFYHTAIFKSSSWISLFLMTYHKNILQYVLGKLNYYLHITKLKVILDVRFESFISF